MQLINDNKAISDQLSIIMQRLEAIEEMIKV